MKKPIYIPRDHQGLPWVIVDADTSDFVVPPLEQIIDMDGIISAPWAMNGSMVPIVFHVALTFEGFKDVKGTRSGVFSIIVQPKDSAILRSLTERQRHASSPRDLLKQVVAVLSGTQMYPGARIDLIGAHYGARGGKRLFMDYSATAGWPILVARDNMRIGRLKHQWESRGLWDRISDYVMGVPTPKLDQLLSSDPPDDPWKVAETSDIIEGMMMGSGLNAGPLRLAGESLFRKLGRDSRLSGVMRPYERGGGTLFVGDHELVETKGRRSTLTIVQID